MKLSKFFVLLIILTAIFFGFYGLEERFYFDWDQERDAQAVWQIVKEHKPTLIGPIAVGPGSFFLGPLWFYLLTPFYVLFNMDPVASAFFAALANVLTTIILILIIKKNFGLKEGLVAGFLFALFFDRSAYNPILIPLFTIIYLNLLRSKNIPLAFLVIGLGLQIHVQILFFLIPLFLVIYFQYKKTHKFNIKDLFTGIFLFTLTFTPLIVFDLRHDFINLKAILNFFHNQSGSIISASSYLKYLTAASGILPDLLINTATKGALVILSAILGLKFSKVDFQTKAVLASFIILPPIIFSIYKGNLSEYYFAVAIVPLIIGIACLLKKLPAPLFLLFLSIIFFLRFETFINKSYTLSLKYKREAVSYIIKESGGKDFILHVDSAHGYSTGFNYLFTYYKNVPKEKGEHLYLISIPWSQREWTAKKMVSEDYKFKDAKLNIFGDIGVFKMY